jgi:hypothetical protein
MRTHPFLHVAFLKLYFKQMKKGNILIIIAIILAIAIGFGFLGYKKYQELKLTSIVQPTSSSHPAVTFDRDEKIVASEVTVKDCKIKITTNKREFLVDTEIGNLNPNERCYQYLLNQVSPSGKYVVFQDLSGGIDSALRVYSLENDSTRWLTVLGTSSIFDFGFQPNTDRIFIFNGYSGLYDEFYLGYEEVAELFKADCLFRPDVPNWIPSQDCQKYSGGIALPNIGKNYHAFAISEDSIKLYGDGGVGAGVIKEYKIKDLLASSKKVRNIKLYYYNTKLDPKGDCIEEAVVPVEREIPWTITPVQDTLRLLITGGITSQEKEKGFGTEFPNKDFFLKSVNLKNGVLTLKFPDVPGFTIGGACRVNLLRWQIEKTAKQFPEVKEVKFDEGMFQP